MVAWTEDVLRQRRQELIGSGALDEADRLLEVLAVTALTAELIAALDRGDIVAASFHAGNLSRQVQRLRPL
ncbi:hypothetical protein SAMN04488564_1276 [Lentzea waywayandensis]|uniref:Uncharacterized protein n=1 Tax=Lentzea waywayandensis TaxID=84724 RepID=A0A1I6FJG2_9PSEU|nr:hypothetical protein SAMN04488564_1276 [Lentzea waywayandensis]